MEKTVPPKIAIIIYSNIDNNWLEYRSKADFEILALIKYIIQWVILENQQLSLRWENTFVPIH